MKVLHVLFLVFFRKNFMSNTVDGLKTEKIIGGNEAELTQLNYIVAVMYKPQTPNMLDQNPCTGAIINTAYIITAAHCFYNETGGYRNKEFYIAASVVDLSEPVNTTTYIRVDRLYIPTHYNSQNLNVRTAMGNVAVVRLTERLRIVSGMRSFKRLKIMSHYRESDEPLIVAGYGWNTIAHVTDIRNGTVEQSVVGESDGKLRYAIADILNDFICRNQVIQEPLVPGNICVKVRQAPSERKGICQNDSGAPLVRGDYLVGIAISGFPECNESRLPGIYLKAGYYRKFILSAMKRERLNARVIQLRETSASDFEFIEV